MVLFSMQSSPVPCHLVPFKPRYRPHQPHPSTPSAYIPPLLRDQVQDSYTTTGKVLVLRILMLIFLDSRM